MLGKDRDDVKNLLHTFKIWVFSWMSLGGVESEEEFSISYQCLRKWLHSLRENPESSNEVKQNVPALDTFLTKTLDRHKQRWFFFPFRVTVNGSMTCLQSEDNLSN